MILVSVFKRNGKQKEKKKSAVSCTLRFLNFANIAPTLIGVM